MGGGVATAGAQIGPAVVITEIHSDPDDKTEWVEFVELHNAGTDDVDLSGWSIIDGILYTFPDGATLSAGAYIVVAQDLPHVYAKWNSGRSTLPASVIWGPFAGKLANDGERIVLCNADGAIVDEVEYQLGFPWPTVGDPVPADRPGSGHSMQLVNPAFDNDLAGSWRSERPTPAAANVKVRADNIPPQVRQVRHTPKQPDPDEVVTITAKVTDSDGVQSVVLQYQLVDPGCYIRYQYSDGNNQRFVHSEYHNNWLNVPMFDDGMAGDERAGDDIYTVQMPGSLQTHRRLVRYRIAVRDNAKAFLTVPYSDDPQPNFAYFVYDDVPAWSGASVGLNSSTYSSCRKNRKPSGLVRLWTP